MLRSCRPAPISPATSASIGICSTAAATDRRKSPSPLFCGSSKSALLSSVIGSSLARGEALQLHLNRPSRRPPLAHARARAPCVGALCVGALRPPRPHRRISTTSENANSGIVCLSGGRKRPGEVPGTPELAVRAASVQTHTQDSLEPSWPGLPRPSTSCGTKSPVSVDTRHKAGHDERNRTVLSDAPEH